MEIYQPIMMMVLAFSVLSICSATLIVQIEIVKYFIHEFNIHLSAFECFLWFQSKPEIDSVVVMVSIVDGFDMITALLAICELCQRLSDAFEDIEDNFGKLMWYRCPSEVKQTLPIVLNMLQQPMEFKCFGSLTSSRDSFKKVCQTWMNMIQ